MIQTRSGNLLPFLEVSKTLTSSWSFALQVSLETPFEKLDNYFSGQFSQFCKITPSDCFLCLLFAKFLSHLACL
jgi:hypothetical protein